MPRAVTRAISTSFATTRSHSRSSSLDLSSGKPSSALDMYPSPRPSKVLLPSSKSNAASSSSPSTTSKLAIPGPSTPPPIKSTKRKRIGEDSAPVKAAKMPERQINTFLANYDLEAENRIRMANQALQVSIESARAQMIASISAFPRHVLTMRLEEYLNPTTLSTAPHSKSSKRASNNSVPSIQQPHKTPRAAKPGEIVYSARGSPIVFLHARGGDGAAAAVESSDEDENEPSFDTASDKSASSESFSLPDEAAYTAQVIEQERNRIMSSEGFFPRSSSMFHRSSSS